ncbi:universal stress protein [Nonomuraea sp. MCN248]|uniref:Universal stress protein n=1 Tax=Nonomuraea corallina TaxID=2989783 RepID=A0ABT4SAN7_9ACTN|nr:universal stress protein [Nonomuraea corallina]MDA0634217.1 universal stress protein [Nonomuraea corallina]
MIIVGVDGSRAGLEAAAWAAREAALRQAPLRIGHAIAAWVLQDGGGRYAEVAAWMRQGGTSVLAAAEERARHERPQVVVDTVLMPGDPRNALVEASRDAELLVIGNHGLGRVRGLLVGSVALGVAGHATCDVVVVRELPSAPRSEIVAGIDGSPASARVLGFAFAEAELRGVALRVVHAWTWPGPDPTTGAGNERTVMREALAGHRESHPGVPVIEEIVQGHPVEVLAEAAAGAELLVVGSRGHGTLAGMVLGSVSQALLQHTPVPLAVVRTPSDPRTEG